LKLIHAPKCLEYNSPGHPERPERVSAAIELLHDQYRIVHPEEARLEDIKRVHDQRLLDQVQSESFIDPDTPAYLGIFAIAKLSAGAAVKAAELALNGEVAVSLMRPPGHHAGAGQLGGFCYFNNIAIATAWALTKVERVAIVDFDCHHGNGTQDIVTGHDRVLFVSLHQSPLYPGTGLRSERNCRNYPLPAGTDGPTYLDEFNGALDEVSGFKPDLIAVSAGFDAYKNDPITDMNLERDTFGAIGRLLADLRLPRFAVLEGGYASDMAFCIQAFVEGFHETA
jgi:acetoin utilization deacetylase AcuC-like enzyme